jgi:AraC-like DNA-binding protein
MQVPRHSHDCHELVLVLRGDLLVASGRLMLPGRPGDLHLFPAGCPHDQGCRGGAWHTICILFTGAHPFLEAGVRRIVGGGDAAVQTWAEQLDGLAGAADADDRQAGDALLTALLHRLVAIERASALAGTRPPAVAAAVRVIEGGLDRDLDVGALAATVGLSRSHLGALFRAHLGCSPSRWHLRLRLERARALLANPYASVGAVAAQLGFTDLNWFVRRFRSVHGLPPGRWRSATTAG